MTEKTTNESLDKREALNGNKSAIIESGLNDLLKEFKGYTANTKELLAIHTTSGALERLLKYLSKDKTNGKQEKENTTLSIVDVNSDDGSKTTNDLSLARLRTFWENPNFTLKHKWPSVKDFIIELRAAVLRYEESVSEHRAETREKFDQATEKLYGIDIKRFNTRLGQSLLPPTINDADREFIYDNLRTNSGELYWVDESGKLSPIYIEESSGALSKTNDFLDAWKDFAYPLIKKYQDIIIRQAELLYKGTPIENGYPVEKFDDILANLVPRIVLQNVDLITKSRKDGDKYIPDGFEITIHGPNGGAGMAIETWQGVLVSNLCKFLQRRSITQVKQFSNTRGAGITYFSLDGINTNGNSCNKRPELPKYWKSFLFGNDGTKPMFACDVEMSLLRLAYFVSNLVLEDSCSRQILFCAGGGNDGKTTLCTVLHHLLGEENAGSVNPGQLENDNNRVAIVNKSFIYMPDVGQPSRILDNSIVKQLTGRDPMAMRKLYCSPFTYTPEHCFVAVTTNKTVYAKGIHQTSRILPLTFQINYTANAMKNINVIESELLSERTEFLQWCFDMLAFYKNRKNINGQTLTLVTGNGLRLLTDARYNEWLNGKCDMNQTGDIALDRKTRLSYELEALNNGPGRFVALSEEDSEESDDELFSRLFNQLFEKDTNAFCSKADLQMYIMANEKYNLLIKALGFKTSNLSYCNRYRLFLKYVRSIEGVDEKNVRNNGVVSYGFTGITLKDQCGDSCISQETDNNEMPTEDIDGSAF